MALFDTYDSFSDIFQNCGIDKANRDSKGRPGKIKLGEWLKAGAKQLQQARTEGASFEDSLATSDIQPWLPRTMSERALMAQEPLLVLSQLFRKMQFEAGAQIEFPAIGATVAFDIAEGDSYPLVQLDMGGGTVIQNVGKSGVAFRITEEARNRSQYDLVQMHLDACGAALARHKEVKAANLIRKLGRIAFDNASPANSVFGVTHGRGLSGAANGSLILDDLFDAYALLLDNGFVPDAVLMHPLTYIMFMKDPELRAVLLAGGNAVWFGSWSGNPTALGPGSERFVSGAHNIVPGGALSGTVSPLSSYSQITTSAPVMPSRWPFPLKIIVSPFLYFDPRTKRADLILCSLPNLGVLIEEYPVRVVNWEDMERDVTFYKLKEAYNFQILNEGQGISVLKNIKMVPNQVVLPAQATLSVSGEIAEIPPTSAI